MKSIDIEIWVRYLKTVPRPNIVAVSRFVKSNDINLVQQLCSFGIQVIIGNRLL
jgi:hypothetical protein